MKQACYRAASISIFKGNSPQARTIQMGSKAKPVAACFNQVWVLSYVGYKESMGTVGVQSSVVEWVSIACLSLI